MKYKTDPNPPIFKEQAFLFTGSESYCEAPFAHKAWTTISKISESNHTNCVF